MFKLGAGASDGVLPPASSATTPAATTTTTATANQNSKMKKPEQESIANRNNLQQTYVHEAKSALHYC